MKTTPAFATAPATTTLTAAATGIYASTHDAWPLVWALAYVTLRHAIAPTAWWTLYVCRKADRKDLIKALRAWRATE